MGIFSFAKEKVSTFKKIVTNKESIKVDEFNEKINKLYKLYNLDSETLREIKEYQKDLDELVFNSNVLKYTRKDGAYYNIAEENRDELLIKYGCEKESEAVALLVTEIGKYNRRKTNLEKVTAGLGDRIIQTFQQREMEEAEQRNIDTGSVNSDRVRNLKSLSRSAQNLRKQETERESPLRRVEEREVG